MTNKELLESDIVKDEDSAVEWRFGVVANITRSHLDENGEIRYGTKAFTSGTKVYLGGKNWNKENPEICVIGRNRFGRTILEAVPVSLLENVRTQRIYKPKVLEIMDYLEVIDGWVWWKRTVADRKETELFVKEWRKKISLFDQQ